MNGGGVFGALIFVIGVLLLFSLMFGLFLIVPFFIFIAGVIVMMVSDRKRSSSESNGNGNGNGNGKSRDTEVVEVVETTTEVREVKS